MDIVEILKTQTPLSVCQISSRKLDNISIVDEFSIIFIFSTKTQIDMISICYQHLIETFEQYLQGCIGLNPAVTPPNIDKYPMSELIIFRPMHSVNFI